MNNKKRKVLIIIALVVVAIGIGAVALISSMRFTIDEICQQLEVQMQQQTEYFDEAYDCSGTKVWTDYSEISIEWHPFENVQGHINTRGRIIGDLNVIVDSPVLYQYLEKGRYSYTGEDANKLYNMGRTIFPHWHSNRDVLKIENYSCMINLGQVILLDSEKNEYVVYYTAKDDWVIRKNGEIFAEKEPYTGAPGGCLVCGGTGTVRYYYGGSALEALLSGHDDYTFGDCPNCDGTGRG